MNTARPLLVVLVGPVGSGKSRLARRLATDLGCTVVANDDVRSQQFSSPSYGDEENQAVYATALDTVERLLKAGRDVVYDGTNLRDDLRERARGRAEGIADVIFVATCVSDEVSRDRLSRRPEGGDHWWAVYQQLCARMQPIRWSFVLADSSAADDALMPLFRRLLVRHP